MNCSVPIFRKEFDGYTSDFRWSSIRRTRTEAFWPLCQYAVCCAFQLTHFSFVPNFRRHFSYWLIFLRDWVVYYILSLATGGGHIRILATPTLGIIVDAKKVQFWIGVSSNIMNKAVLRKVLSL